ncbi:MAG: flagellar basal body-associated FliL family protein [Alphaproteobacteria bacterium]
MIKNFLIALLCCFAFIGYTACAEGISGPLVTLPDLIVKLQNTSGKSSHLKISLKIALEKKEDQEAFENVLPRVEEEFQTYLNTLGLEDLKGSAGIKKMKAKLLDIVRMTVPNIPVKDVLFEEILVQQ